MKPLPSPSLLPLSSTAPLSEKTPLVVREYPQEAASRAAASERIQAATAQKDRERSSKNLLSARAYLALGLAFGLGVLVGYCAVDRH